MQLTLFPFFLLVNLPFLLAAPVTDADPPFAYEQLTFIFAGGPASYTLTFPADGNMYPTSTSPLPFPRLNLLPLAHEPSRTPSPHKQALTTSRQRPIRLPHRPWHLPRLLRMQLLHSPRRDHRANGHVVRRQQPCCWAAAADYGRGLHGYRSRWTVFA